MMSQNTTDEIGETVESINVADEIQVSTDEGREFTGLVHSVNEDINGFDKESYVDIDDSDDVAVLKVKRIQETPDGDFNHYNTECVIVNNQNNDIEEHTISEVNVNP